MANEKKTSRKKFRVAVSGSTVDGREISPVHLREAAENFNPDVYAARVNVEHYLSPCPSSEFSAMGDVTALSTEDITEGPLAGRTALYAEIEPTERMKQLVADGKKIYSSIELHPQFSVNGRAYLVGLAMTDTPASLGTERLKFTAQQRQAVMTFNSVQGEAPLISEAIESEIIEMAEQRQEEGTQWFNRVMGIIGRGRKADDASFSRIQEGNVFVLRKTYQNEQAARRAAAAKWQQLQRGAASFSITLARGRAELYPEMHGAVTGFKSEIDNQDWIIAKAEHTIDNSGFTTQLELEAKIPEWIAETE
ncbi:GPO family capsid scaffolding protein [Escherichia coli]